MEKVKMNHYLDFDDVLIRPQVSSVNSREDVDISVALGHILLSFPVIAAPMRGIVNADFIIELSKLGGMGILHRFYDTLEEWKAEIKKVKDSGVPLGISVGQTGNGVVKEFLLEYQPDILLIDVANGYTESLHTMCANVNNMIAELNLPTLLMAGNVATYSGYSTLISAGVDMVRVGLGSGGVCSTRNVTGIGIPQISAILNCSYAKKDTEGQGIIIADGGIKNSGDGVKAFVAGADVLMLGSLFAQTFESPSDGIIYGMASRKLQEMRYTQIKSIEGFEAIIEKRMSLEQFVDEFSWGIKSAGTYLDARNIDEIKKNGDFLLAGTGSIKKGI
jgi:IMP dehydrogenase